VHGLTARGPRLSVGVSVEARGRDRGRGRGQFLRIVGGGQRAEARQTEQALARRPARQAPPGRLPAASAPPSIPCCLTGCRRVHRTRISRIAEYECGARVQNTRISSVQSAGGGGWAC
jgi:hypothetical protein